jgi:hypothetical protein
MLIHAGAGLHGHEYSDSRCTSPELPKKQPIPFLRSALRTTSEPNYRHRSLSSSPSVTPDLSSAHGSLPSSPDSFNTSSPPQSPRPHRRTHSDVIRKKDSSVRFRDPPMDVGHPKPILSEDDDSLAGSEFGDHVPVAPRPRRRKRSTMRSSTRFAFAHPAPALRNKQRMLIQIRPRVLLQLQQVGDKRAIPAFDVVPSSLLAGSLIIPTLAKKFTRAFRAKPELNQNDVLIVRSEDYDPSLPKESRHAHHGHSSLDHRDVLAVISTFPYDDDHADIALGDGSVWAASRMANGSYEFTYVDARGKVTTARWARRAAPPALVPEEGSLEAGTDRKWTFSIINPETRRHPILGTLTPTSLDIYDTYSTMSTASGRLPPARQFDSDTTLSGDSAPSSPRIGTTDERLSVCVTEEEKNIMMATAIWISLRQDGWPASANPKLARTAAHCRSASMRSLDRARSLSGVNGNPRPSSPSSGAPNMTLDSASPPSLRPRRTKSTGAAFMENRRRMSGLSVKQDDEPEELSPRAGSPAADRTDRTDAPRSRVRELAHRLFHRKTRTQSRSSLKYQLKE